MTHDETPPTAARDTADAWDRVGQLLQNAGTLGNRVVARNLDLWSSIRAHLSHGPYTADAMAADLASTLATVQENLEDAWSMVLAPPQRERYAQALPTAFLFFDRQDGTTHTLLDPVYIPVPPNDDRPLPPTAEIALDGTSSETAAPGRSSSSDSPASSGARGDDLSRRGVSALLERLTARLDGSRRYRLETVGLDDEADNLVAGVYDGLVYLKDPALPLANVRVVVEGPPPSV